MQIAQWLKHCNSHNKDDDISSSVKNVNNNSTPQKFRQNLKQSKIVNPTQMFLTNEDTEINPNYQISEFYFEGLLGQA